MTEIQEKTVWPSGEGLLKIGADRPSQDRSRLESECKRRFREMQTESRLIAARSLLRNPDWVGAGSGPEMITLVELAGSPLDVVPLRAQAKQSWAASSPHADGPSCSIYRRLDIEAEPKTFEPGSAILHVTVEVDPDHNAEFLHWYVGQHVPAIVAAPGIIGARRFEEIPVATDPSHAKTTRRYCTIYEMTHAGVVSQPETQEASREGACPVELEPYRRAANQVYDEIFRELETS